MLYTLDDREKLIVAGDLYSAYQFKLFTGKTAPAMLLRKAIKQATNPVRIH